MGSRLIPRLVAQGHEVVAPVRPGSEHKLPATCTPAPGDALGPCERVNHILRR